MHCITFLYGFSPLIVEIKTSLSDFIFNFLGLFNRRHFKYLSKTTFFFFSFHIEANTSDSIKQEVYVIIKLVHFNRGYPAMCYIQSGWTHYVKGHWIWPCSGNVNRGFAVVKFNRGILVWSSPSPCCIQSWWTHHVKVHFEYDGALVI